MGIDNQSTKDEKSLQTILSYYLNVIFISIFFIFFSTNERNEKLFMFTWVSFDNQVYLLLKQIF